MSPVVPSEPSGHRRPDAGRRGPIRRTLTEHPWAVAVVLGVLTIPAIRPCTRHVPDPPPVFGSLPAFELLDATGSRFGSDELADQVWVAGFFYADDPSPRQVTAALLDLHILSERADVPITLVGVTVDPGHDPPERLARYGQTYGLDALQWHLLTGEPGEVRALIVDGFRSTMGDRTTDALGRVAVARSERLVLVDGERRIRGWYPSTAAGVDEVFHRAQHVLSEARRPP